MTLLQIKYILECSKTGSLSLAAANMFTTTSNMSKLLKSLEDEIGYSIFERSPYGLIPTEKGQLFLMHADNIVNECSLIQNIDQSYINTHLTIASLPSSYACYAFNKLSEENSHNTDFNLQFNTVSSSEAISLLKNHLCDISIVACDTKDEKNIEHNLRHQGFHMEKLAVLPVVIYIAKNHPLLSKYTENSDILHALMHYPYIEFNNNLYLTPHPVEPYINHNKIIKINDRSWRYTIMNSTNGFSAGSIVPDEATSYKAFRFIPIPDAYISICILTLESETLSQLSTRYLQLLTDKLKEDNLYNNCIGGISSIPRHI